MVQKLLVPLLVVLLPLITHVTAIQVELSWNDAISSLMQPSREERVSLVANNLFTMEILEKIAKNLTKDEQEKVVKEKAE